MAAKPIERHIVRQIKEQGGWPRIVERIASGETVADVARSLKRPDGTPISRSFVSNLLHADAERSLLVKRAQVEGASAMVDHAIHLVDSAAVDRDSVNKAKVGAEIRLKVAGLRDRETWGERPAQLNVQVNVEGMHLDSLRHRSVGYDSAAHITGIPGTVLPAVTSPPNSANGVSHACETGQNGSPAEPTAVPTVPPEEQP